LAVADLKKIRGYFNNRGLIAVPGETLERTNEGVAAYDEAIEFMQNLKPVG
jgi:hypothetical protein